MSRNNDGINEEFNNFMFRVNEISSIITKLTSKDRNVQDIGELEARQYLGEADKKIVDKSEDSQDDDAKIDDKSVELRIKTDRTVLNKAALHKIEDPAQQSLETFKSEISKDAERRYQDRLKRKSRMEILLKRGNLAFRRNEFEKALNLYGNAINELRDNPTLYLNRALTYQNLGFYDKAIDDLNWALRLNEDSLKAWLLMAKSQFYLENLEEFHKAVDEAKTRHPQHLEFINGILPSNLPSSWPCI